MDLGSNIKDISKHLFYHLGITGSMLWFSRKFMKPKFLILMYHRISSSPDDHQYMSVPAGAFEEHLRFIKENFKTVSMKDGVKALYEDDSDEIYANVNLDDGYMDNYLYAYPLLEKYDVPATIFLTTDFIGKSHVFWWDEVFDMVYSLRSDSFKVGIDSKDLRFSLNGIQQRKVIADHINALLKGKKQDEIENIVKDLKKQFPCAKDGKPSLMLGWDEIKEMNNGLISFGAHTRTHRNLCLLEDDEVYRELVESKREIENRLGVEAGEFSYPYGAYDERVTEIVKKAGFTCARATLKGFNYKDADRFLLSALGVGYLLKASSLAARISFNSFRNNKRILL